MDLALALDAPARRKQRQLHPALLPGLFFAFVLLLILLRLGRVVELFYPAGAVLVGLLCYRRSPTQYVSFLCWLYFLSPEVRRIADFSNGAYNPISPIQMAPSLVAVMSGLTVLTHYRVVATKRAFPSLLLVLALIYALVVGCIRNTIPSAVFSCGEAIIPIFVGFHILATWKHYPIYARVLVTTFSWGMFVVGAYGVIQYVLMPPWDAMWLLRSGMDSVGQPSPFSFRVFSTLNAPGPLANVLMSGLLFILAGRGKVVWVGAVSGLSVLLLTEVRAAWGGLIVGGLYALACIDGRTRSRVILAILIVAALSVPIFAIDEFANRVLDRMQTVSSIKDDHSFQARLQFYESFLSVATSDIAGQGMGSIGIGTKLDSATSQLGKFGVFDSGLMEIPYVMGWPGTLLYVTGLLWMIGRSMKHGMAMKSNRLLAAAAGTSIGLVSMLVFCNPLNASGGILFQIGVALPVIGHRHARMLAAQGGPSA
ncbi:O-antigen ligase family protein [Sorangium sp. So ce381]|uniref:O-antigen ligase family protein n=1 Tax=Sorangium sp. So ce381 TaxID=3133307 RepID=UPI003F5B717E